MAKPVNGGVDSVADFIDKLRNDPTGDHVIRGMVKAAVGTTGGAMFAHEGDCDHWVHIPATAMKNVRVDGHVRCAAHSHMVAEIQLKDPEDELTRTFASLANLHRINIARLQASMVSGLCNYDSDCSQGQHCGPDGYGGKKCLPGPF